MITIEPIWLLMLPLVFGLGWLASGFDRQQSRRQRQSDFFQLVLALQHLVRRERREAMIPLLRAARENPDALGIQRALASLHRESGEPDRALEAREMLLLLPHLSDRERAELEIERAEDAMACGMFDRAEAALKKALTHLPADALLGTESSHWVLVVHELMRQLYERLGRWADALQAADWRARHLGDNTTLLAERFHYLMNLGRRSDAEALMPEHPRLIEPPPESRQGSQVCRHCGFRSRRHDWQCGGCRLWDQLTPLA